MSSYLWKYYLENDVERFRTLLANAAFSNWPHSQKSNNSTGVNVAASGFGYGSPGGGVASSPKAYVKGRKISGGNFATANSGGGKGPSQSSHLVLTRADINSKDNTGITILQHAASSITETSVRFALVLLDHPLIDLYVQDLENGWTALHRAVYFGNITIARAIIDRDTRDSLGQYNGGPLLSASGIIRVKDKEGFSPFDVLASTISYRVLDHKDRLTPGSTQLDDGDNASTNGDSTSQDGDAADSKAVYQRVSVQGDEVFAFGSNKNITLGFGDGDDRQYPERITLRRPDHLLHRFYREYRHQKSKSKENLTFDDPYPVEVPTSRDVSLLPSLIRFRPILIQDVSLSKLHTAVLTTDPESNLYMCGFGPGGRLGTGDEITRFNFVCIEGGGLYGKKVIDVGLGQNHTLAVDSEGGIYSWGSNNFGQLGYLLPKTNVKDEEPIQNVPRQIFGPLKREMVIGAAASSIHSAVHTSTSLYTFGKNEGQLGLVDSDAGSLEVQVTPRKVGASRFSSPIRMVSAIDRATICLLQNHEVWVFANYGYTKMVFPLDGFTGYFLKKSTFTTRYNDAPNHISKITSGGDTICAMSSMGDVFTVTVNRKLESGSASSTTNPTKIRNALSQPKRIWSLKKGHMAVRDVEVGQDGSIIICTDSGSVWKRVKRAKIKDANTPGKADGKAKDYKFLRVPGLTSVTAVRSNAFGAYAAVRRDCDVPRTQILVKKPKFWDDIEPLLSFKYLNVSVNDSSGSTFARASSPDNDHQAGPRASDRGSMPSIHSDLVRSLVLSPDFEKDMTEAFSLAWTVGDLMFDLEVCSTVSDVTIPAHCFILTGRSTVFRAALSELRRSSSVSIMGLISLDHGERGTVRVKFQGLDFLSILNLVVFLYQDTLIDVWHYTRLAPKSAFRFRQIRTELMRVAVCLELSSLEAAVRVMIQPTKTLCSDMENSVADPEFFANGDAIVQLADAEIKVHSVLMCQRCPFFEGLFRGRAAGGWLSSRRDLIASTSAAINVDLKHIESAIFKLVLRHIYADTGEELFDDVVAADIEEFLDVVMDVLSVANELMLDRLSQVCQKLLGRFVTTRNACQLLNAVSPCSVTEFKDALLEYLCLNLETMLENHLLDELDEDLLLELDLAVRANQLACLPHAKSGRAEALLHERNPDLAQQVDLERRSKINYFNTQARIHEDENRLSCSLKPKGNALDILSSSPTSQKSRRRSARDGKSSTSPALRPRSSGADLMFDMDDEDAGISGSKTNLLRPGSDLQAPASPLLGFHESDDPASSLVGTNVWLNVQGKPLSPDHGPPIQSAYAAKSTNSRLSIATPLKPPSSEGHHTSTPTAPARRWEASPLPSTKLDMREIMEQASASRTSNISLGLSFQPKYDKLVRTKLSQKERKKQQHQSVQTGPPKTPNAAPMTPTAMKGQGSPWQGASAGPKVSLKDIIGVEKNKLSDPASFDLPVQPIPSPDVPRPTQKLISMRHIASSPGSQLKGGQPRTEFIQRKASEQRSAVLDTRNRAPSQTHAQSSTPGSSYKSPVHALSHDSISSRKGPVIAEPSLQLSMADIISQQQAEQEIIRGTVMKRSLQEIQQEQEFQSWWDAEEAKVKEAAEASARSQPSSSSRGGRGGRGGEEGGSGRGRGRGRGRGNSSQRGRGGRGHGAVSTFSAAIAENNH